MSDAVCSSGDYQRMKTIEKQPDKVWMNWRSRSLKALDSPRPGMETQGRMGGRI